MRHRRLKGLKSDNLEGGKLLAPGVTDLARGWVTWPLPDQLALGGGMSGVGVDGISPIAVPGYISQHKVKPYRPC